MWKVLHLTVLACSGMINFGLFLWDLHLTENDRQAECVIEAKPNNYAAKSFQREPLTLAELKAFLGLQVTIEMLIHKDRYQQYLQSKDAMLTFMPSFPKVMTRDRFLAI